MSNPSPLLRTLALSLLVVLLAAVTTTAQASAALDPPTSLEIPWSVSGPQYTAKSGRLQVRAQLPSREGTYRLAVRLERANTRFSSVSEPVQGGGAASTVVDAPAGAYQLRLRTLSADPHTTSAWSAPVDITLVDIEPQWRDTTPTLAGALDEADPPTLCGNRLVFQGSNLYGGPLDPTLYELRLARDGSSETLTSEQIITSERDVASFPTLSRPAGRYYISGRSLQLLDPHASSGWSPAKRVDVIDPLEAPRVSVDAPFRDNVTAKVTLTMTQPGTRISVYVQKKGRNKVALFTNRRAVSHQYDFQFTPRGRADYLFTFVVTSAYSKCGQGNGTYAFGVWR